MFKEPLSVLAGQTRLPSDTVLKRTLWTNGESPHTELKYYSQFYYYGRNHKALKDLCQNFTWLFLSSHSRNSFKGTSIFSRNPKQKLFYENLSRANPITLKYFWSRIDGNRTRTREPGRVAEHLSLRHRHRLARARVRRFEFLLPTHSKLTNYITSWPNTNIL